MREILFRGKNKRGEWIEGTVMQTDYECRIAMSYLGEKDDNLPVMTAADIVDPETVGECTWKTDGNEKYIFEGDIIRVFNDRDDGCLIGVVKFGEYDNPFRSDNLGGHLGFYLEWKEKSDLLRKDFLYWQKNEFIEVIGNIYDNPGLLTEARK